MPGDRNDRTDVFVRDRVKATTTLVSVATAGAQGNQGSWEPSISADGRYVAFESYATNLASGGQRRCRMCSCAICVAA